MKWNQFLATRMRPYIIGGDKAGVRWPSVFTSLWLVLDI